MRKLLLLALLPLAGCANMQRGPSPAQVMAADPTVSCMNRLVSDPFIVAHLSEKLGVGKAGEPTIQMLSDKSYPDEEEKAALSSYSAARQSCIDLGIKYRRQSMPLPILATLENGAQRITVMLAKLYGGEITFGEYNTRRVENTAAMRTKLTEFDQQAAEAQAFQDQQRRIAVGQALQNFSAQMQAQQQMQQQQQFQNQLLMQQNRPVNTTCQRFGSQVNCTSY